MPYICQLPEWIKNAIKNDLVAAGIDGKSLDDAMNSKLCDLEDTIDIGKYECWVKEDESLGWIYTVYVKRTNDAVIAVSKSEVRDYSYLVCLYDLEYGLIDDVYVDNSHDVMDVATNLYNNR